MYLIQFEIKINNYNYESAATSVQGFEAQSSPTCGVIFANCTLVKVPV